MDKIEPAMLRLQLQYLPGGLAILNVGGAVDFTTAPTLQDAMIATVQSRSGPRCHALLDLSGVNFLNASGVTALLVAHHHATTLDIQWQLCAPQPLVRRVINLAGLHRVFPVHADLQAALAAPQRASRPIDA